MVSPNRYRQKWIYSVLCRNLLVWSLAGEGPGRRDESKEHRFGGKKGHWHPRVLLRFIFGEYGRGRTRHIGYEFWLGTARIKGLSLFLTVVCTGKTGWRLWAIEDARVRWSRLLCALWLDRTTRADWGVQIKKGKISFFARFCFFGLTQCQCVCVTWRMKKLTAQKWRAEAFDGSLSVGVLGFKLAQVVIRLDLFCVGEANLERLEYLPR
jgi:hypothetical protein